MVNEGGKAGILEEMKKEIIEGAFDFDETTVREIMTPRTHLKALELNTSFHQVLDMVIKTGHSRIPVYRQHIDHIVGVILAKDLLNFMVTKKDIETIKASDLMRECVLVPETNSIRDAFKDLQRSKNHIGIIIDEYGGTAGVVTMEDILEEFFGEIQDEFDVDENKIVKKDDGLYEVNGTVSLEEFLKYFGITKADLSEENLEQEVETVAGLITFYVGQIPKKGQSITLGSYKLTVTDVEKRHIKLVNVESLRKKEKPDLKFFHGKKTKR